MAVNEKKSNSDYVEDMRALRVGEHMIQATKLLREGMEQAREALLYLRGEQELKVKHDCNVIETITKDFMHEFDKEIDKAISSM